LTSVVVSGWPAMPQSPLWTSSTTTQVTWRRFSPSTATMASVSRWMIWRFWVSLKTPSMTLTLMSGMVVIPSPVSSARLRATAVPVLSADLRTGSVASRRHRQRTRGRRGPVN